MSTIDDLKKTVTDTTPIYAALGVTDLAVEKAKEARTKAEARAEARRAQLAKLQDEYKPARLQAKAADLAEQAQQVPALALGKSLELAANATEAYEDLAERGTKLAERIRNQKATKDLVHQAESTVALGKGYVTTVQKGATDVQRSAKALVTTGRREAAKTGDVIVGSVAEEAQEAATEVKKSAARTRTAAKRTQTTTRNASKRAATSRKATTTSARKTAARSTTATRKAAEKVGN